MAKRQRRTGLCDHGARVGVLANVRLEIGNRSSLVRESLLDGRDHPQPDDCDQEQSVSELKRDEQKRCRRLGAVSQQADRRQAVTDETERAEETDAQCLDGEIVDATDKVVIIVVVCRCRRV